MAKDNLSALLIEEYLFFSLIIKAKTDFIEKKWIFNFLVCQTLFGNQFQLDTEEVLMHFNQGFRTIESK